MRSPHCEAQYAYALNAYAKFLKLRSWQVGLFFFSAPPYLIFICYLQDLTAEHYTDTLIASYLHLLMDTKNHRPHYRKALLCGIRWRLEVHKLPTIYENPLLYPTVLNVCTKWAVRAAQAPYSPEKASAFSAEALISILGSCLLCTLYFPDNANMKFICGFSARSSLS
jgi:hypothetical protein